MATLLHRLTSLLPAREELRAYARVFLRHGAVLAAAILILNVVFDVAVNSWTLRGLFVRADHAIPPYAIYIVCIALAVVAWVRRGKIPPVEPARRHPLTEAAIDLAQLIALTLFFAVPFMKSTWQMGGDVMMAGRFPYSDAQGYYEGGWHVLHTGTLDPWCQRRPLNALLMATRLGLSGGSLHGAMLLQVGLLAVSALILARAVARDFGLGPALFTIVILGRFCEEHSWTTMSETLGLTLGTLALAVLWIGARERKAATAMGGIFLMTLACSARAGPQLMLPLLALWMGWAWRGEKWFSFGAFGKACAAVVLAMVLNAALLGLYGSGAGVGQGNFSVVLYGYARGTPNWGRIYSDHPEIQKMPEQEAYRFAYKKAFESIRQEPGLFLQGLKAGASFFIQDFRRYFNQMFRGFENSRLSAGIRLLLIAGLLRMIYLLRRDPLIPMLLALVAGMLLSAPLVYPDGWYRVLVAAYPALAVVGAVGISGWQPKNGEAPQANFTWHRQQAAIVAGFLIAGAMILPAIFHWLTPERLRQPLLGGSAFNAVVRLGPGSPELEILPPESDPSHPRQVRDRDYDAWQANPGYVDTLRNEFGGRLRGPMFVTMGFNLQKDKPGIVHIVSSERLVPERWTTVELNGRFEQQNSLKTFLVLPPVKMEGSRVVSNTRTLEPRGRELSFDAPAGTQFSFGPPLKLRARLRLSGSQLAGAEIMIKDATGAELKLERKMGGTLMWDLAQGAEISAMTITPEFMPLDLSQFPLRALPRPFEDAPGVCRKVKLPELEAISDNLPAGEEVILYEDGKPMAAKGFTPQQVYSVGLGRYCFWEGEIWFCASDNSALATNGREYTYRVLPRPAVQRRVTLSFDPE